MGDKEEPQSNQTKLLKISTDRRKRGIAVIGSDNVSISSISTYIKRGIPKQIKNIVWDTYIGETIAQAPCHCCKKTQISIRDFHCGHVTAESKGGSLEISNLRPICRQCNNAMATMNMNDFMKLYGLVDSSIIKP